MNIKILKTVSMAFIKVCQPIAYALIIIAGITADCLAEHQSILITYSEEKSFVRTIAEQLRDKLESNALHIKTAAINSNHINSIDKLSEHTLIVALGSNTTETILKLNIKTPLVSLLVPRQSIETLKLSSHPDQPWTTLLLDQPMERQFLLIKHLLGKDKKIGTLLSPHSARLESELIKAAKNTSLTLSTREIRSDAELINNLELLTSRTDVLLTIPDPIAFNRKTIRSILLLTYRNGIPVIGFSKSYVKAGAIASLYSEPVQISEQAAGIIKNYLNTGRFEENIFYPDNYMILTNHMVARTLGIKLTSEDNLLKAIKREEQTR